MPIRHIFTYYNSLGGVQSVLKHHYANDADWNVPSQFVAVFEDSSHDPARLSPCKQTGLSTIRSTRRIFKQIACQTPPKTQVYHNLWGLPIFADLDRSPRRIGLIHSDWPTLKSELDAASHLLDGVLCVSNPLVNTVLKQDIGLDSERVAYLPYPILKPASTNANAISSRRNQTSKTPQTLVVGFCGRLVKTQKRVDRLKPVCDALDSLKVPFRLEILGSGQESPFLENQFRQRKNVIFHGQRSGEAYWQILASWDAILFVSDYEGLPISLLEAMSLGVVPIYPRIHSGGDSYAKEVAEELLFDPMPAEFSMNAARAVQWLHSRSPSLRLVLSDKATEITKPHSLEDYFRIFSVFIRRIAESPRISSSRFSERPHYWTDHLPYALMERFLRHQFFRKPIRLSNP